MGQTTAPQETEMIIPANVHVAAKRAFLRTTAQAFAASVPTGGIAIASIVGLITEPDWIVIIATILAAILTPFLAGLSAYLNILSKGIPEAYIGEVVTDVQPIELDIPYTPKHSSMEGNTHAATSDPESL